MNRFYYTIDNPPDREPYDQGTFGSRDAAFDALCERQPTGLRFTIWQTPEGQTSGAGRSVVERGTVPAKDA